jgi:hypothetical protein
MSKIARLSGLRVLSAIDVAFRRRAGGSSSASASRIQALHSPLDGSDGIPLRVVGEASELTLILTGDRRGTAASAFCGATLTTSLRRGGGRTLSEACGAMIVANGLAKRYGDKTAVDDLSFEVRPGTTEAARRGSTAAGFGCATC